MSYRLALCAFCLAFVLAMPLAQAQTTNQSGPSATSADAQTTNQSDPSATSTANVPLAEIVVTAQRTNELLTAVPESITAYTANFMQKQHIQSFVDYATKIPNLSFQYGQGADLLWSGSRETTIRGVAGEGTTAYYINDTPVPSSVSPQTLDLERIEVLKGPQGTLFGESSMGGTVRFITKKPSLETNTGALQLQGGGTEDAGFDSDSDIMGNLVLVPGRLGVNAAFGYTHDSGYSKRRFPDASGQLITVGNQGADDIYTGSVDFRARLTDSLEASLSVLGESTYLHGFPAAYVPLPGYRPLSYTQDRERDVPEYSKDRWGLGAFVLNYSAGGVSVVSSTSFFKRRIAEQEDDTEGTNFFLDQPPPYGIGTDIGDPAFPTVSILNTRLVTQETRLSFANGTLLKRLSGTVGVFYQHSFSDTYLPIVTVPAMAAAGLLPDFIGADSGINHGDSSAVFGQLYYDILPKLTLTLGARHYWITQTADPSWQYGFIFGPDPQIVPGYKDKESGLVPKAVLSYKVGDQGNVYASASKGFRAGGSQQPLPSICDTDLANLGVNPQDTLKYTSDTLWNYEVGAKSLFADGRVSASAAAFDMDWSNIQQSVYLPLCTLSYTANAGKARIRGGELELSGQPIAGVPFSVQLGLGYTHGVLLDPGYLQQPAGSPLGFTPEWTGSISTYYTRPITSRVSLFVAADYSYTDSLHVPTGADFNDRQPLNFVDCNIGISFGRSQLMLYGKNLLDKRLNLGDQPSSGFERQVLLPDGTAEQLPRAVVSRPRQLGLQYQVSF